MNVDALLGETARDYAGRGRAGLPVGSAAFRPGDQLELTVLERLSSRRYRVQLGNSSRTVESNAELTPGTRLRVRVAVGGERLVLQASGLSLLEMDTVDLNSDPLLAELATRHQVSLDAQQRELLRRAMGAVEEPKAMAAAGLFLGKLGLPLELPAMQALYETLLWLAPPIPTASAHDVLPASHAERIAAALFGNLDPKAIPQASHGVEEGSSGQTPQLMAPGSPGPGADGHEPGDDGSERRELAQQFLNTQNQGSVGYRYGVLPLLVAGQLIELDLVCFQAPSQSIETGLRRLTLSFNSAALGRVEVTARVLGTRLVLNIRTATELSSEALADHADEVRELATRLGWNIESLSYGHDTQLPRAATQLVQHVLSSDTLSRLL